jgi:hypothetical protein
MHKAIEAFQAANRVFDFVNITLDLIQQDENGRTSRGQERATNHSATRYWMRDKSRGAGTDNPTIKVYTGTQYLTKNAKSIFGLYDYNARWYDCAIGRFKQVDSIVQNPAQE